MLPLPVLSPQLHSHPLGMGKGSSIKILLQGSDIKNGLKGNGTGGNCGNFTAAAAFAPAKRARA